MAKCDICGQTALALQMQQLLDHYRVDGVVDMCPECTKWADEKLREIRSDQCARMRNAIIERKGIVIPCGVVAQIKAWLRGANGYKPNAP